MAKKEEEVVSVNPWLDKEYKQGLPLFTREPGLEIDDLPERLGLLDDVTVKDSIEATKFIELADTSSDYGLDKQFPVSDGEGAISWAYPFWKPTGSSIYFRKRVAVGHSHPMVEFHVYKPQTKVQVRIGAKENPWVEWESTDETNGFAAGIGDAANKLFKINYDSPIGTASQLFLCVDAGNTRVGWYTASPQVPYHIKESACASATYHPYAILAVESTTNAMIQVSAGTNAGIVFCDDDSNPPAGGIVYDHPNEQMEFICGMNERMWLTGTLLKTDVPAIEIDSTSYAVFIADSHNDNAYVEFQEDNVVKWTVGFHYSDSLKFKISEGLPGTSSRFEITSGGAIQLPNANQVIQWTASAGGSGGLQYTDSGSAVRYALLFPGSDIVALVNRAANGTVELRANTSSAGSGGEVTVVTIQDTDVILADGIGFNLQEDITFTGATGVNLINFPDNLADALSFKEGANAYLTFVTTNGSELVKFGKSIVIPDAGYIGSASDADAMAIASGGEVTLSQTLVLSDVINAGVDTDKFLVLDGSGNVDYRTGAEVANDIEASVDHGSLAGLADDDHTQYVLHTLSTAANNFLVGSGSNTWIKKTLAEAGAILEGDMNHDNLQGFVGNEHIDHSAVSVSSGGILSGGGTIAANRTISLAHGDVDHDQTANFASGEHFTMLDEDNLGSDSNTQAATQQSIKAYVDALPAGEDEKVGVDAVATAGYLGAGSGDGVLRTSSAISYADGGDFVTLGIDAAYIEHHDLSGLADDDHTQYILHSIADAANDFLIASGANTYIKKTLAQTGAILEGDIDHDNLQGVDANKHVVLPGTIANVLSDHNKAAHDALNIDADTLDSHDTAYFAVASHAMSTHSDEGTYNILTTGTLGAGKTQVTKTAVVAGSNDYHIEMYSPDTADANKEISIRFHQGGRYYYQIRARSGGLRFTAGNTDVLSPIFAGVVNATSLVCAGTGHDGFSDMVVDEHIAHSGVTLTAGTGLTGGGTIAASRTFNVDVGIGDNKIVQIDDAGAADNEYCRFTASGIEGRTTANVLSDIGAAASAHTHDGRYFTETEVTTWRSSVSQTEMSYLDGVSSDIQTQLNGKAVSGGAEHDGFSDFVANEHINHTGVSITAGAGMTGGGTIAASRTLNVIAGTGITVAANSVSTNDAAIVHDSLSGFVANEHINHTSITMTAGSGLSGGGTIAATRTFNLGTLTANWDAGSYQIRALQFYSDATPGTPPFQVSSTDKVGNLNSDYLRGYIPSMSAGNSTVVVRTASGYIYCNYLNCTSGATSSNPTHYFVETGNDSFLRQMTPANFVAALQADGLGGGGLTTYFRAYRAAAQAFGDGVDTRVLWDTEKYDIGGNFAASIFTAPATGYYCFHACLTLSSLLSGTSVYMRLRKAGPTVLAQKRMTGPAGFQSIEVAAQLYLTSGTWVEVTIFHTRGANLNISAGETNSWFEGHRLDA